MRFEHAKFAIEGILAPLVRFILEKFWSISAALSCPFPNSG